jgi:uncharacterized protein YjlB
MTAILPRLDISRGKNDEKIYKYHHRAGTSDPIIVEIPSTNINTGGKTLSQKVFLANTNVVIPAISGNQNWKKRNKNATDTACTGAIP